MRKVAVVAAVSTLAIAGVAVAAGPTITAKVAPDTPNSHSTLSVSAKGPFSASGLPKAVQIDVQKGFRASAKSVAALCDPKKPPCPKKSEAGSGDVVATVSLIGQQNVPFTLYLGKPQRTGDIASIVLAADILAQRVYATGRLFISSRGGLEILFSHFPKYNPPPGVTVSLRKLYLAAHATRKAGTKTYALITNPPKCGASHWDGTVTVTFSTGSVAQHLAIPCSP